MRKRSVLPLSFVSLALVVFLVPVARADEAPWLTAPGDLSVHTGRGALLLYVLDKEGNRVPKRGNRCGWEDAYQPKRWTVVTGVVDHRRVREQLAQDQRIAFAAAHPRYKRLDMERQERAPGGAWSDWREVDHAANEEVLNELSEEDEEHTPDDVRCEALVDPLPILQTGRWEHADLARLVGRPSSKPSEAELRYPTSNAPELMLRYFDFTVRPGWSYRYRLRVVVYDPREELPKYLTGPWSAPTEAVAVPTP